MTSILARLESAADRRGAITFVSPDGADGYRAERVEWARLHAEARAAAGALQARGIGPGNHVAILGPTTRPLVTAVQATWLTGATLVMLPLPMRLGSIEEFVAATRGRILGADADVVVVDPDLAEFLDPRPGDPPVALLGDLLGASESRYDRPADDPSSLAVIQFTSGSTAAPKGVMLRQEAVLANLDAAVAAAGLDVDHDVFVSWLPLYHDMGLIGLLTLPMISGTELVLAAPQDFLAAPSRWMQWMSDFGGTVTAGPNFSYALAARALGRFRDLDLSRWRVALNGAETVDPSTVEAFCAAGAVHGLDPRSAFCAFGMAEVTIAATFPEPFKGMSIDAVDRRVLETDRYAAPSDPTSDGTRRLARLGRPISGLEIRIVDPTTAVPMSEREVGELEIRGTSLTCGYYNRPDADAESFRDGWLRTGDLGYLADGELVVCGRIKDVIIVGGRNVFPEDVERAAAAVDGVRAGNVIAFGTEGRRGREALVVVAETRVDEPGTLREEVSTRVCDVVGVPPEDVVLVRPGTIPKTSSGKLQRSLCRTRYLEDVLEGS